VGLGGSCGFFSFCDSGTRCASGICVYEYCNEAMASGRCRSCMSGYSLRPSDAQCLLGSGGLCGRLYADSSACVSNNCQGSLDNYYCCAANVGAACTSCSSSGGCTSCSVGEVVAGACATAKRPGAACSADAECTSDSCKTNCCAATVPNCATCGVTGACSTCDAGYTLTSSGTCLLEAGEQCGRFSGNDASCASGKCRKDGTVSFYHCCAAGVGDACTDCAADTGACTSCSNGLSTAGTCVSSGGGGGGASGSGSGSGSDSGSGSGSGSGGAPVQDVCDELRSMLAEMQTAAGNVPLTCSLSRDCFMASCTATMDTK
jgi:hypothetical protein